MQPATMSSAPREHIRARWLIRLIGAIAFFVVVLAAPADATHRASLGELTCSGAAEVRASPGEVVEIEACFTDGGSPLANHPVLFLQDGPSPLRSLPAKTDAQGRASLRFSSPKVGYSRVGVCDSEACMPPMLVTWSVSGATGPDDPVVAPSLTSPACASPQVGIPAFAELQDVASGTGSHPKSGRLADQVVLATAQNFTFGAAEAGSPASIFTAFRTEGQRVDETGPYPFRGFNRLLVFFTNGDVRWGKAELVFDDGIWSETDPTFTVALDHSKTTFYADEGSFPEGEPRAGTKVGSICDSIGIVFATAEPQLPDGRNTQSSVIIGIGVLLLLSGLSFAVIRSSEPPSSGALLRNPAGPPVRTVRGELRFDVLGRINAYSDVLELADGTTFTIRARVIQEDLVVEVPLLLDSSDWDDEVINMTRHDMTYDGLGRLASYREENVSVDGTRQTHIVDNIVYDRYQRVVRYLRSTVGESGGERSETFILEHDDPAPDLVPRDPLRLAKNETLRRREMRFDEEEHLVGYAGMSTTDGSGEVAGAEFVAAVPKAMFETGESFGKDPCFVSLPNKGIGRMRNVLTRWFRSHGCKINIVFNGDTSTRLKFGELEVAVNRQGRATLWALKMGNYAVSVDDRLVGWVIVKDVPGTVGVEVKAS